MDEIMTRIDTITDQYLERFGRVRVGIYCLTISKDKPFTSFLNSLLVSLRRMDLMPCYTWLSTAVPDTRYLIIWCNGYFRTDLSDVNQVIFRMGELHSLRSLYLSDSMIGDTSSIEGIKTRLNHLISWNYSPIYQYHQRSFGMSAEWK